MEYPSFFGLADRWFWAVAIFVIGANVVIMKARAAVDVRSHPEKRKGYNRLIAGIAGTLGLLFAYPVIAILSGRISSVFELMDLMGSERGYRLMLGFYFTWLILGGLLLCWVWFWGGLKTFASYRAIFNLPKSEQGLRLFFGGMTVFFLVAAISSWIPIYRHWIDKQ